MAAAIGVRSDYASADLRQFARRSGDRDQVRRLLAVALILDGGGAKRSGKDCRRHATDRAELGAMVRRGRPRWAGDEQGAGAVCDPE